jgi:hypothetical protein
MGDFERGLIQGEAMRHQIEKTNIDLLAENTKLREALEPFKKIELLTKHPQDDDLVFVTWGTIRRAREAL